MTNLIIGVLVAVASFEVIRRLVGRAPQLIASRRPGPVLFLALVAALGAALAPGHPTALPWADAVLRAAMAASVTVASARARRLAWLVASGAAVAVSGGAGLGWLAFVAAGAALAMTVVNRRSWVVGSLVGLCTSQVILRLHTGGPTGTSAAVAFAVATMLLVSGSRRAHRRTRRRLWRLALVVGSGAALASGASVVAALQISHDVRSGLDSGGQGVTIAGQDDAVEASVRFDASADAFGRASAGLQTWWARPALVVPVVGREVRAATVLSSAGQRLARAAAAASTEVDLAGLRVRDGRIDLIAVNQADRVISGVLDEVRRAQADVGSVSSPWLIRPLAKAVHELNGRLLQADRESTVAKHVLDLVGPMAGSEGSRRWLLAVVTPAEERGSGGLVGNVGEVTAVAGKLDLVNIRRIARLNDAVDPAAAAQVIPKIYSGQYSGWNVSGKLQNALVAPDFPTGAHALLAVQPLAGQGQVDGVISVDPLALAAILQLVGPVRVAGWPDPIDSANAATVLLHDQYVALQGNAREDFLGDVTDAVWARITSGTLPSPATLARTLKPLVDGRHIQLYSGRQAEEAGIVRVGAGGVLPESGVDHVALVANNASESKADWYLHRSLDYRVQYDPGSGLTDATVTVKLTNDAPATGLPAYVLGGPIAPPGYNRQIVEVHTPLDLVSATVDGRPPAGLRSLGSPGHHVDEVDLVVAPRSTATIELHLRGQQEPSLRWSLDVGRQPSIYADDVSVSLRVTGGWRIVDAGGGLAVGASDAAAHLRLNGPRRLTAILGPKP